MQAGKAGAINLSNQYPGRHPEWPHPVTTYERLLV